ncbi:MAG: hypothetical protein EOM10_15110, partial [Opitutae bacterium]|nr:hypothetical protein [Opitutae bacterium]
MFETRITRKLGIRYPIIGGTMMSISTADFVAAISNAGGLGILASAIYASQEDFAAAIDGITAMIERAAEAAANEEVASLCRRVAHRPPETFREAIQLIWFVMLAIQSGDRCYLVGPGRLDRRAGKFYDADLAAGRMTRAEALKLIEALYLFINSYCPRGLAYA